MDGKKEISLTGDTELLCGAMRHSIKLLTSDLDDLSKSLTMRKDEMDAAIKEFDQARDWFEIRVNRVLAMRGLLAQLTPPTEVALSSRGQSRIEEHILFLSKTDHISDDNTPVKTKTKIETVLAAIDGQTPVKAIRWLIDNVPTKSVEYARSALDINFDMDVQAYLSIWQESDDDSSGRVYAELMYCNGAKWFEVAFEHTEEDAQ